MLAVGEGRQFSLEVGDAGRAAQVEDLAAFIPGSQCPGSADLVGIRVDRSGRQRSSGQELVDEHALEGNVFDVDFGQVAWPIWRTRRLDRWTGQQAPGPEQPGSIGANRAPRVVEPGQPGPVALLKAGPPDPRDVQVVGGVLVHFDRSRVVGALLGRRGEIDPHATRPSR